MDTSLFSPRRWQLHRKNPSPDQGSPSPSSTLKALWHSLVKAPPGPPPFPLPRLPTELQLMVISYLSPLDKYTLRLTSRFYYTLIPPVNSTNFLELENEFTFRAFHYRYGSVRQYKGVSYEAEWQWCGICHRIRKNKRFGHRRFPGKAFPGRYVRGRLRACADCYLEQPEEVEMVRDEFVATLWPRD